MNRSRSLRQAIVAQLSVSDYNSPDTGFWKSFDEREWKRVLPWLGHAGLALYFWRKMKTLNAQHNLPLCVRARLERCYADNSARSLLMAEEFKALNKVFEDAGVKHVALKGFALVPDYCPDPTFRMQYDHDYLMRPESLERAENILQNAGYSRKTSKDDHSIIYLQNRPAVRSSQGPIDLYSAALARSVELHLRLWESTEERIEIGLPEDFWDRALRRHWRGHEYTGLSDEDTLLFHVLHAFRHILGNWCRLSLFLETSHFLWQRAFDADFWERYADRIRNLRWLPQASGVVFSLAASLFGASIPPMIKVQTASAMSPALTLWIERYGKKSALANFRNDKHSLFLHREFIDNSSAWAEVRRRRLFPLQRPHCPPPIIHQRSTGRVGRAWINMFHVLRRLNFHAFSAFSYAWEYPQWWLLRRGRGRAATDGYPSVSQSEALIGAPNPSGKLSPKGPSYSLAPELGAGPDRNSFKV